jgi:ABC-type bacteriocin/lantibiotic exporter with double-glycine peptidase domain
VRLRNWRTYLSLFGASRRLVALSLATAVAQSLMLVPIGLLVREAFDDAIPNSDTGQLVLIGAAIVGLYFGSAALGLWARHAVLRATKAAITRLRQDVVAKLLRLPRAWFDRRDSGTLHATVVQDSERLDVMGNQAVAQLLPGLVVGLALSAALLWLNPLLFALLLTTGPVMVLLGRTLGRATRGRTRSWQQAFDRFSSETALGLRTMTLTKVHAAEDFELARRSGTITELGEAGRKMAWLQNAYTIIGGAVTATSSVVVLVVGGAAVARGSMSLGDLLSFYALVALMRMQAAAILGAYPHMLSGY